MFRTTIALPHLLRACRLLTLALGIAIASATPNFAQVSSRDDEVESSVNSSNLMSRLFGSPTKKASPPPPKRIPATQTAGTVNRNGFLLPLKSFTKAFRGNSEGEVSESMEQTTHPHTSTSRVPREPFRNLPRSQERRDRATNDIHIEQKSLPPITQVPAPVVQYDSTVSSQDSMSSTADSRPPKSRSKPVSPVSSGKKRGDAETRIPELVIESNATSRRTAMDTRETESSNRQVLPRPTPTQASPTKYGSPKNLLEIGLTPQENSSSKSGSNALTSIVNEKELNNQVPLLINDEPKTPRIHAANSTSVSNSKLKENGGQSAVKNAVTSNREMGLPGVRVLVDGPNALLINQDAAYEVVVKNEGKQPLGGLAMRIAVPHHVSLGQVAVTGGSTSGDNDQDGNAILWELDNVTAGGSKSLRVVMQTSKPEHFALGIEWSVQPQSTEFPIQVQQPQLAVALEGPSEVEFGKPQMYRVRVRNPGNSDAKSVSIALSAEPYGSNRSDIGDIPSGTERIVEVEFTFQQSGTLPIKASATSSVSQLRADSAIDVHVRQSELVATWYGPTEFYQGSIADFELELTNTGTIPAVGTVCKVKLPTGAEVVSLPPNSVQIGDAVRWEVSRLDSKERITFPLRLKLTKFGENHLGFIGECNSGGQSRADFMTTVDSIADLQLFVVDPAAPAPVGQPVVYEIVITNRGKKAASDVDVIAQFSEGIEPIRVEGHTGRIVPGQAIFNSIPSINPNEKLVLRIVAEATKPGVHRFRAEVKSLGSDTDLLEEESTRYLATGLKSDRR